MLDRKRLISRFIRYNLKTHEVVTLKYRDQLEADMKAYFGEKGSNKQCYFTDTYAYVRERKWILLGTDSERRRYIRTGGKIGKSKIVRLGKDGEEREYDTIKEASIYLGCKPEKISNYAFHKRKYEGYIITFHEGDKE